MWPTFFCIAGGAGVCWALSKVNFDGESSLMLGGALVLVSIFVGEVIIGNPRKP